MESKACNCGFGVGVDQSPPHTHTHRLQEGCEEAVSNCLLSCSLMLLAVAGPEGEAGLMESCRDGEHLEEDSQRLFVTNRGQNISIILTENRSLAENVGWVPALPWGGTCLPPSLCFPYNLNIIRGKKIREKF